MKSKTICKRCNGRKIIEGHCECNMEWRSSGDGDYWDDCICEPDLECPDCKGTGFIE
ncbi:MAG: ankyrin [Deltaproteobacteria bacterium]|nr:ankyrin [Deltaproteobacteria bacterium]